MHSQSVHSDLSTEHFKFWLLVTLICATEKNSVSQPCSYSIFLKEKCAVVFFYFIFKEKRMLEKFSELCLHLINIIICVGGRLCVDVLSFIVQSFSQESASSKLFLCFCLACSGLRDVGRQDSFRLIGKPLTNNKTCSNKS